MILMFDSDVILYGEVSIGVNALLSSRDFFFIQFLNTKWFVSTCAALVSLIKKVCHLFRDDLLNWKVFPYLINSAIIHYRGFNDPQFL